MIGHLIPRGIKKIVPNSLKNIYHFFVANLYSTINGKPASKLRVIGVTGTDGKTTTSTLLYHILQKSGKRTGLNTSIEVRMGKEVAPTGFHVTTPDPGKLQKFIKKMVKDKVEYLVLETTSHALAQHRVAGIKYNGAVFTNVTKEHLDYHKTYDAYLKTKSRLINKVSSKGFVIINKDDSSFDYLFRKAKEHKKKILTYSIKDRTASIFASNIKTEENRQSFTINHNSKEYKTFLKIPGQYNISNTLAAFGAAVKLGVKPKEAALLISEFETVEGRWEVIQSEPFKIIVDFAHTPNALEEMLHNARTVSRGKVIVVFGCAGERDFYKRPEMGKIAAKLADITIITADDPRSEDLNKINKQIEQGISSLQKELNKDYYIINDRTEALKKAISLAAKGDIVIATGKGHEKSMNLDGKKEIPWSDQKIIKQILNKL